MTEVNHKTSNRSHERSEYRRRRLLAVDDGSHGDQGDTEVASVAEVDKAAIYIRNQHELRSGFAAYIMVMVRLK